MVEWLHINLRQADIDPSITTLNERLRNMGPIASMGVMRIIDYSRRLRQIRLQETFGGVIDSRSNWSILADVREHTIGSR